MRKYKKFYNEIAKLDVQNLSSQESSESPSKEYRWDKLKGQVFNLLDVNPEDLVLDVGCGFGQNLFKIEQSEFRGVGIDIAVPYILWNHEEAKGQGKINLDFLVADVHYLPFKKETFDKIIFSEVIEHIHDPKECLKELHRICKKEAQIILTTPNKYDAIRISNFIYRKTVGKILQFLLKNGNGAGDLNNAEVIVPSKEKELGVKLHERVYTYRRIRKETSDEGFGIETKRAGSLDTYPIHESLDSYPLIFSIFKMLNGLAPDSVKNDIILKLKKY